MGMAVVRVGKMRMGMGHCSMLVSVGMPALDGRLPIVVPMVMVPIIMPVGMLVPQRRVGVAVDMPLRQMQGHPHRHQSAGQRHRQRHRLTEPGHGQHRPQERRH